VKIRKKGPIVFPMGPNLAGDLAGLFYQKLPTLKVIVVDRSFIN
jgi:hypothetical protein